MFTLDQLNVAGEDAKADTLKKQVFYVRQKTVWLIKTWQPEGILYCAKDWVYIF